MQMFNKKNNEKAKQYVEYGLSEYAKVFIKKPLSEITLKDITVSAADPHKDQKLTYNEFVLFYNNYAYFVLQTGANKEAEPLLRKVVEIAPNRAVAYIDLGNVCWNLGIKEEAKEHYRKYLELLGNNTSKVPGEIYERLEE
jgi:Flp pilus assembly protein TadD